MRYTRTEYYYYYNYSFYHTNPVDSDEYSVSTGFTSFDSYSMEEGRGHPRRKVLDMLTEHLTKEEKASVLAIPHANNPEDIKLFAR